MTYINKQRVIEAICVLLSPRVKHEDRRETWKKLQETPAFHGQGKN